MDKETPNYIRMGGLFLAVAFLLLWHPGDAVGQMPTALSLEASRQGMPPGAKATYRLRILSGKEGAAFGFQYTLPTWPTSEAVVGSPLRIASVRLTGSGSIEPAKSQPLPQPALRREEVCRRERTTPFSAAFWVQVPPNSTTIVELVGEGTYPRWPGTSYNLSFSTFFTNEPGAPRTPLGVASTPALGAKGTRIQMKVAGKERKGTFANPKISGRTFPPLRFARVVLRAVRPPISGGVTLQDWMDPRPLSVPLGSVRTDQNGRFHVPARQLPAAGRYALIARTEARGSRAADWNCGPFFDVG